MAIAKLILNNATQMDLTADTVTTSDHIMEGYVGHLRNGTSVALMLQDQHGRVVKNEEFTTEYEAPVEPKTEEN